MSVVNMTELRKEWRTRLRFLHSRKRSESSYDAKETEMEISYLEKQLEDSYTKPTGI